MAVPTLTANSPSAGYIAWTSFHIQYNGTSYAVNAGNTNDIYVYWLYNSGSPSSTLSVSNTQPSLGPDDCMLFLNKSGVPINIQDAQFIDGDIISTGTVTAANIAAGTITGNLIQAGTITSSLIGSDAIVAGAIAAGALDAYTINAPIINGGTITAADFIAANGAGNAVLVYSSPASTVQTFFSSGSWVCPPGVTSIKAECWGGGGGGGGSSYPSGDTPGSAGGGSTFSGASVTVTAHGGGGGSAGSGSGGGAAGTGSTNSVHYNGGAGNQFGGGGGSAGSGSAGNDGSFAGGAAVPDGGPGGNGGIYYGTGVSTAGSPPATGPGGGGGGAYYTAGGGYAGGGGGGGEYAAETTLTVTPGHTYTYTVGAAGTRGTGTYNGASGYAGQVRISYSASSPTLMASIAGQSGTDAYGNAYPQGFATTEFIATTVGSAPATPTTGCVLYYTGGKLYAKGTSGTAVLLATT